MASKVNPKCRKVEIGVRTIREITIWPLSLADELEFSSRIVSLMNGYEDIANPRLPPIPEGSTEEGIESILQEFPSESEIEIKVATYIITAIKENLVELLAFVTEEEVSLNDVDNDQFMDLCDTIFEMNFAGAVGKGMRLLSKVKSLFQQKTQSEKSSSQPVTGTNTSSDSAISTVE